MSEEKKKLFTEIVENLKQMDRESLMIMKSNSEVLKARDALDATIYLPEEQKAG